MTLTMPLDLAAFFEVICPISTTFVLGEAALSNETGGGEVIRSDYGTRLWGGTVTLSPDRPILIDDVMSLVRVLQDSRASFLIYPRHRPKARAMATVATPTGQINSLPSDNRLITLKALTAGFVITRGDWLSFLYGSSPVRYALHQAVESLTANGSGVTGQFEVIPPIRPGAAVDANVRLNKPWCKAVMVPGSLQVPELPKRGFTSGVTFAWRQTLR